MIPFGLLWVESGRACLYFGSVDRLGYNPNAAFAEIFGQMISEGDYNNFSDILKKVNTVLTSNPEMTLALKGFNSYRMVGDPLQPL